MRPDGLRERLFDPRTTNPKRASLAMGMLVGTLALIAAVVWHVVGLVPGAMLGAAALTAAIALPVSAILTAQRDALQEARDLWGLSATLTGLPPLPQPGGWALSAGALTLLLREIRARRLHTVVELGPGTSSVVLGRSGLDLELTGLEHDADFARVVQENLAAHEIEGYKLVHTPLVETFLDGRTVKWYSPDALVQLPPHIDVLLVDGPPNWNGAGNRRPAWPTLRDRMSPGGIVLVDDTHRSDERRMAMDWVREGGVRVLVDAESYIALEVV